MMLMPDGSYYSIAKASLIIFPRRLYLCAKWHLKTLKNLPIGEKLEKLVGISLIRMRS